jgi:D-sedoheptulose 7-phosphate isomerase
MEENQFKLDLIELIKVLEMCQSRELMAKIHNLSKDLLKCIKSGGKLITFGNGCSSSESSHLATELVSKCKLNHTPWPAINLSESASLITAIGNDYGFETIFERQVETFVNSEDLVIAFSTSGFSQNVIRGLRKADAKKCRAYLLTGANYKHSPEANWNYISIPSLSTMRIQEVHLLIIHFISEYCEINY